MFKRLLAPLDGSGFGSRALLYASEIAQRFGAEVILIQVVKAATPIVAAAEPGAASSTTYEIALQAELEGKEKAACAKRYLSSKIRSLRSQGVRASYHVVVGDPANSIMEFCHKEHIDIVVMTTHGKSGLERAIMGSVADQVIRESGTPILVILPQMPRESK